MKPITDPKVIASIREHLFYKPTRVESLHARLVEVNLEISDLLRVKAQLEVEIEKELKNV